MAKHNTGIQWLHKPGYTAETWNPIAAYNAAGVRGWHCEPNGPGCLNCYAWQINENRPFAFGTGLPYSRESRDKVQLELVNVQKPLAWRKPRCVFVNSMFDLFQPAIPEDMQMDIFDVMVEADDHIFIVLTKYEHRMYEFVDFYNSFRSGQLFNKWDLPEHIWMGVTAENQKYANKRVMPLGLLPAAGVKVISYEPALGPINFQEAGITDWRHEPTADWWILVGGESGANARPFNMEWAMSAIVQCDRAGIPVFVKQMGDNPMLGNLPVEGMGRMGKALEKWPAELRRREFPKAPEAHRDTTNA